MNTQLALTAIVNRFMEELKLSEADVAARCGVDISTVRRVTRGTGKYSTPATVVKLMQGIGISPERFCAEFEKVRAL